MQYSNNVRQFKKSTVLLNFFNQSIYAVCFSLSLCLHIWQISFRGLHTNWLMHFISINCSAYIKHLEPQWFQYYKMGPFLFWLMTSSTAV